MAPRNGQKDDSGAVSRRRFLQTGGALAAASLLPSACSLFQGKPGSDSRPNIVWIISDELQRDYLQCYGGRIPTPNLDSIARNGVQFQRSYCVSAACTPSRFSLLTGQFPGRCQHPAFLGANPPDQPYSIAWNTWMTPDTPCVARMLRDDGYFTGFVGKWHLSYGDDNRDWDYPAFERDEDPTDPDVSRRLQDSHAIDAQRLRETAGFEYAGSVLRANYAEQPVDAVKFHNFEWMTQGALDFLDQASDDTRPFFLYVATTAVHGPGHDKAIDADPRITPAGMREEGFTGGHPPRSTIRPRLEKAGIEPDHIAAGMTFLDDHVGALLKKLRSLGLEENTLILFAADHNTEPGKATCYEKGVHTPMLMQWPAQLTPHQKCHDLVEYTDFLPTSLAAAGTSIPQDYEPDGINVLPAVQFNDDLPRETVYMEMGIARAIRKGDMKYIAYRYPQESIDQMKNGEVDVALDHLNRTYQAHCEIALHYFPDYFDPDQLYDLKNDPYEQHNLAGDPAYADVLAGMKREMGAITQTFDHPFDLDDTAFYEKPKFRELAAARQNRPLTVSWWQGKDWPPSD